jgi:hypothetical protein
MKNIQLFHSYNYVNGNFIQKDKNVYDTNNNLIFSLLNIPNPNDLYSIKIQRILKKKCFSKKKNKSSYYTKHNVKIFIILNSSKLYYYINNNIHIPDYDILCNLILNNNYQVNNDEYIDNIICINKNFNKQIKFNNIIENTFNYYRLNDLYYDISNKKIVTKKNMILKKYGINGSIIYYDLLSKLLDEIISLNIENLLIICNSTQSQIFKDKNITYTNNINKITKKNTSYNVVLLDSDIPIDKLKYKTIIVCVNKTQNIKIDEIITIYYNYFNIDLFKYCLNVKLIYNILDPIIFRNYSNKIFKLNYNIIDNNKSLYINKFDVSNIDQLCYICYNDNICIKTKCEHYFCSTCIMTITNKNKFICPYCRTKNNIVDITYLLKSKLDILNSNIANIIKFLIKKSLKTPILILSNNDRKIKYMKQIYKFMGLSPCVNNINNISNFNDINNIYFLESQENYNLIKIYNNLFNKGIKKTILHFFIFNE